MPNPTSEFAKQALTAIFAGFANTRVLANTGKSTNSEQDLGESEPVEDPFNVKWFDAQRKNFAKAPVYPEKLATSTVNQGYLCRDVQQPGNH